MKRILTVALAVLAAAPAFAQRKATIENVPEIPYTSVPNFLKLPPGEYLGESVAVATNSKGHIFVYHRSANTRLFEFDQAGNFVKEIGSGYYGFEFAHSVRVDKDDNIWTVDEGTNMVTKFSPDGKVLMVLGRRPPAVDGAQAAPAGPNQPAQKYIFCRPTDVGWDPQGNIFVSDGYCNNRVVKYDKNGRFLAQAGSEKAGNALGEFNLPHGSAGGRTRQCLGRRPHQLPLSGARQQPEAHARDYQPGRRLDGVHFAGPAPIRVLVELESEREHAGNVGHHRRNLQGGTGRDGARQVRSRRQTASRLPGGSHDGLPQSERDHRGRNRILAGAETHSAADRGRSPGSLPAPRDRRTHHETP